MALIVGLVALAALAALVLVRRAQAQERAALTCLRQSVDAFMPIHDALEAYSAAHVSDAISTLSIYPAKFSELSASGYLPQLPANPFGSGQLTELKPGEPDRVGGFRYVPVYASYRLDTGEDVLEPYLYMFVLYTPRWPVEYPETPFDGRLGRGPMYAREKGQPVDPTPHVKTAAADARSKRVKAQDYDTDDAALKRAGY